MNRSFLSVASVLIALCLSTTVYGQSEEEVSRADMLLGALTELRTAYDVQYYDLDVEVDIANKSIAGSNEITFETTTEMAKMQIDLAPNMTISSIKHGNAELNFTREESAVFIDLDKTIGVGIRDSILVAFSGKPVESTNPPWTAGFVWSKDTNGKPWVGVACEGEGASVWFPNKDHLSDEPDNGVRVSVTVPDSLKAVSNGRNTDRVEVEGGKMKYVWETAYSVNNYNITLYVGDYMHYKEFYKGPSNPNPSLLGAKPRPSIDVDYYVLRANIDTAKIHFDFTDRMLEVFESLYGPYPFPKDGFAIVESPYLGMEHQSAIAYGNNYQYGYRGQKVAPWLEFDYLFIHEAAHEWWGNNISADDYNSIWIHESFATYTDAIFAFSKFGMEGYYQFLDYFKERVQNDEPILGKKGVHDHFGTSDAYYKGALMLNTISQLVESNADWFKALTKAQQEFRAPYTVSHEELTEFLSEELRMDLSKVFEQYLETTDIPKLEIKVVKEGRTSYAVYRWTNVVEGFEMPIKLKTERFKDKWIYPTASWKKAKLPKTLDKDEFGIDQRAFYVDVVMDKSEMD